MRFSRPLVPGTLIRRYQRFLAGVRLEDGSVVTAVCPNTGSMRSCNEAGRPVLLSESDSPSRKYRLTWEMIRMGRSWVGIHTGHPNRVTHEAILAGRVPELAGYTEVRREVPFGRENSRVDLLLRKEDRRCYVEVKNVTLVELKRETECCGFGGTFSVKQPAISAAMVKDKVADIAATGASTLVAGDCGCLMNITGAMKHSGVSIAGKHLSEFLWERTNGR